jgi:RNA polymerase sigma factor (sigma-70 family)
MAHAAMQRLTEYIRRGVADLPADCELVRLVAIDRDQPAFTALVRRHGKAVRAACRRVLGDTADADDAFQATFVALWRCAQQVRKTSSVGAWLYGTAHRIACQARAAAARRRRHEQAAAIVSESGEVTADPSWREACGVLHEEIDRLPDRYRLPLVLCYLHGFGRDEAAAKLGWSVGSVKGRLERGRERLRQRLTRRGIDLSAGLLAVVANEADAALPAGFVRTTVDAAVGGPTSTVAALISGSGLVARTKIVVLTAVMAIALAGAGVGVLVGAGSAPAEPRQEPTATGPVAAALPVDVVTFHGRVLDPNGKPVPEARLFAYQRTARKQPSDSDMQFVQKTVAGADGRFQFEAERIPLNRSGNRTDLHPLVAAANGFGLAWALLPKPDEDLTIRLSPDQPINGRILNSEGRPVAGGTVQVREVIRYRTGRLDGFLAGWRADWQDALYANMDAGLSAPPASMVRITEPDRDGRFRIDGVGAERFVILDVRGTGLAQGVLYVLTRPDFDFGPTNRAVIQQSRPLLRQPGWPPLLYGPTLDYVGISGKPLIGTIREVDTGRPVVGARITSSVAYSSGVKSETDSDGHFRLEGLRKKGEYSVFVQPPSGSPLISQVARFSDSDGYQPLTADVKLTRGVILTGRVVDRASGRGVPASVCFHSLPDESAVGKPEAVRDRLSRFNAAADSDGRFRLPLLPGPGVLTVDASGEDMLDGRMFSPFLPAEPNELERKRARLTPRGNGSFLIPMADGTQELVTANVFKRLDVADGIAPDSLELFVERGRTIGLRIEDPDGKPLAGTVVSGMTAMWPMTFTLPTAECTLYALQPGKPRTVVFYHPERKNVGVLRIRGDETGPLTVRLSPAGGVVTGRVVDVDGNPVMGVGVTQWYSQDESARELFRYLTARGGPGIHTKTDMDGRFWFETVVPGLRFELAFANGTTPLASAAGKLWFAPYLVSGGKTLDLGDLPTKPAER